MLDQNDLNELITVFESMSTAEAMADNPVYRFRLKLYWELVHNANFHGVNEAAIAKKVIAADIKFSDTPTDDQLARLVAVNKEVIINLTSMVATDYNLSFADALEMVDFPYFSI